MVTQKFGGRCGKAKMLARRRWQTSARRRGRTTSVNPAYGDEYAPLSPEIVGMRKQMLDEMIDWRKLERSDASKRKSDRKLLVKAKMAEIKALADLIEGKLKRIGELSVKLVMMREDLEDTKEALGDNSKLLKAIDDTCAKKKQAHERNHGVW